MSQHEDQLPRSIRLRHWMTEHGITCSITAKILGCSNTSAWRFLQGDTIPPQKRDMLVKVGFPQELLPDPYQTRRGRPSGMPEWLKKNMDKLAEA
jgi:hypothetical protein